MGWSTPQRGRQPHSRRRPSLLASTYVSQPPCPDLTPPPTPSSGCHATHRSQCPIPGVGACLRRLAHRQGTLWAGWGSQQREEVSTISSGEKKKKREYTYSHTRTHTDTRIHTHTHAYTRIHTHTHGPADIHKTCPAHTCGHLGRLPCLWTAPGCTSPHSVPLASGCRPG